MMARRPTTFGELVSLRRTMDRLFDDPFFRTVPMARSVRRMPLDVIDTPDSLILEAALPGVRPDDIDVSVLGDVLTLTAGTDVTDPGVHAGFEVRELRRGRVSRSVTLPQGLRLDDAAASFENGLLQLTIPKAKLAERRQIHISVAGEVTEVAGQTTDIAAPQTPDAPGTAGDEIIPASPDA
jgi:HSP20 family protein